MKRLEVALGVVAIAAVLATPAHAREEPPVVAGQTGDRDAPPAARWSVAASIGPIVLITTTPGTRVGPVTTLGANSPVTAWQVELVRRRDDRRMIFGGALEGTYGHEQGGSWANGIGPQLLGAHAFVGAAWRFRSLSLDGTLGAGLEAAQVTVPYSVYVSPSEFISGQSSTHDLGVYFQGALAAALSITDSIDVVLQFATHLTPSLRDESWFGASMIGVRYTLP